MKLICKRDAITREPNLEQFLDVTGKISASRVSCTKKKNYGFLHRPTLHWGMLFLIW